MRLSAAKTRGGENVIVHIFKCPTCGDETERTEEELKGVIRIRCNCDAMSEMQHNRVVVRDANGDVTAMIL